MNDPRYARQRKYMAKLKAEGCCTRCTKKRDGPYETKRLEMECRHKAEERDCVVAECRASGLRDFIGRLVSNMQLANYEEKTCTYLIPTELANEAFRVVYGCLNDPNPKSVKPEGS